MIKSTLAIVALLFIGVTFAYAEEPGWVTEEALVVVPFDYHGQQCFLVSETVYHCNWQGHIEPFTVEDLEAFADVLSPEVYAEELAKLQAVPKVVEVEVKLTPEEKIIQQLEDKLYSGQATATEATHLRLLQQLDECQRGLGNSAAIQDRTSFVISEFEHGKYNNIKIEGQVGHLLQAIQECKAQQTLEYYVLSEEYTNKANGDEDVFYDHHAAWNGIQALDYELYTKNSDRIDMNDICDNNQYTWKNRIMMGCEDTRDYGDNKVSNPSGVIHYYSDAYTQYQKFLAGYGNQQATIEDKHSQELIAQPIAQEMIDSNTFYQNHKD